uniref:Reverse transcriptase domain-containing protein n=1 Tax=Tanacetum cinerariifolium TaxID=118510 RepID=A0A699JDR7_TANCI|nr:reverse transcriptase domain-containing protein [Tanacetum cinerariifolium]
MITCNAGRRTAATRGGRTGGQTGRGGGRTGEQTDRVGGRTGNQCGRGDHISNQRINGSRNDNATDDSIQEDDRNFDGKGDAVAYIRWVEKMKGVQDISGCGDNQKVKYSAGSLTGKALTWWNSKVRTRGREAAVGMT